MKKNKTVAKGANVFSVKRLFKVLPLLMAVGLASCSSAPMHDSDDIHANTVMITNLAANHGGTGVILRSSETQSLVLTNSHVCKVVESGGLVSGVAGKFMVSAYKHSIKNDLCLIKVDANLQANTKIATTAPVLYRSKAIVSGHPALMPNVVTRGQFSGRNQVSVMTGITPCTEEDQQDPQKGLMCMFLGGIPTVRSFDSVLVSATIMPGSSGSAVYNDRNELSGLIFAGQGDIGYGWIVPYESVRDFLFRESKTISYKLPTNLVDVGSKGQGKDSNQDALMRLHNVCKTSMKEKLAAVCELTKSDALWYK